MFVQILCRNTNICMYIYIYIYIISFIMYDRYQPKTVRSLPRNGFPMAFPWHFFSIQPHDPKGDLSFSTAMEGT